jgi:LPS export ABC transporter protein LptC
VPRRPLTTQAESGGRVPDQVIENGTHTATREGVKKAVMEARRISFFNLDGKVEADTVRITFFDGNGVPESRLSALFGEIDQRTEDMLARGQVLILAEDGTRIEGQELRYDATRDQIVSTQPVTIFQDGSRIRGAGVEADPALTNIRITGSSAVLERTPRVGRESPRSGPPSPAGAPPAAPPVSPGPQPGGAQPAAPSSAVPPNGAPTGGETPPPQPPVEAPAQAAPGGAGEGAAAAAPDSGG